MWRPRNEIMENESHFNYPRMDLATHFHDHILDFWICQCSEHLRHIVEKTSETINRRALFENPFLTACELREWIADSWGKTLKAGWQEVRKVRG